MRFVFIDRDLYQRQLPLNCLVELVNIFGASLLLVFDLIEAQTLSAIRPNFTVTFIELLFH